MMKLETDESHSSLLTQPLTKKSIMEMPRITTDTLTVVTPINKSRSTNYRKTLISGVTFKSTIDDHLYNKNTTTTADATG